MKNKTASVNRSSRYAFIAEHRGGPLSKEDHNKLIHWARICSEHVLGLIDTEIDARLTHALHIAKEWPKGKATTGEAMKASLGAHAAARAYGSPVSKAVARSVGQAVATAHMADHSLGGAFYALKALKLAGKNIDKERQWQSKQLKKLPAHLVEIVQVMWSRKALDNRI